MPYRFAPLLDLTLYLGGIVAFLAGGLARLWAQVAPPEAGGVVAGPAANAAGNGTLLAVGGLITIATPLVLRIVDVVRLKAIIRRYNHYVRDLLEQINRKDAIERKMRDFMVRAAREHDFDLPPWFFADPPPMPPGTGDHAIILPPDPDAELPER